MCSVDGRNVLQAENVIERAEQAPAKKIFWMFRSQAAQVNAIATSQATPLTSCRDQANKNESTNSWTRIHDIEGFARNIRRTLSLVISNLHFY